MMKLVATVILPLAIGPRLSAQNVLHNFQHPPKSYRPMVRWWWPGGNVQNTELRREVDILDHANFGGAEIQPFNKGLSPTMSMASRARVNDYLTPTFFSHVQAAVEQARARGMWMGKVKDTAQISINNHPGPVLLLWPYRADVTFTIASRKKYPSNYRCQHPIQWLSFQGPSLNYLPETTGTTNGLLPSGLIGPVTLETAQ